MDPLSGLVIRAVDPSEPPLRRLIDAHLAHSWEATPQTSNHTLSPETLSKAGVVMFGVFDGDEVIGCGGLKPLGAGIAEVKSVHVSETARGRGVARILMTHLHAHAAQIGVHTLVLETGADHLGEYDAARGLYERLGYAYCGPIPGYAPDPNSAFMRLVLEPTP